MFQLLYFGAIIFLSFRFFFSLIQNRFSYTNKVYHRFLLRKPQKIFYLFSSYFFTWCLLCLSKYVSLLFVGWFVLVSSDSPKITFIFYIFFYSQTNISVHHHWRKICHSFLFGLNLCLDLYVYEFILYILIKEKKRVQLSFVFFLKK